MKATIIPVMLLLFLFCSYKPIEKEIFPYRPVLMERSTLEQSISFLETKNIEKPGKIYIYGTFLFVNEKFHGIHIYDNKDPSNPIKKGFIRIPGCIDMAVKDNTLYADNAVDLVAIRLIDIQSGNVSVTKRITNVFPEIFPPNQEYLPFEFQAENRPENTIIVNWEKISQ